MVGVVWISVFLGILVGLILISGGTVDPIAAGILSLLGSSGAAYGYYEYKRKEERGRVERNQAQPPAGAQNQLDQLRVRLAQMQQEIQPVQSALSIELTDLSLLVNERVGKKKKTYQSRMVNIRTAHTIRPVVGFIVNQWRYVGKSLPLEFNIVDPYGIVRYRCPINPTLRYGKNYVAPQSPEFPINEYMPTGVWQIRVWMGQYEWGEVAFSLINLTIAQVAGQLVGDDMELNPGAMIRVNQINGSIDDLLKG